MAFEKFTVDESMAAGWQLLLEHFWTYLRLASLAVLLMFLPDLASIAIGLNSNVSFLSVIFMLLGIALKGIIPMGLIYIQIRLIDGHPVSSDDFWKPAGKYWAFLGATLIYIWVVAFGLLFLVAPGIIFGIMFQFYPYFIVEHRLGPIQALKASAAITSGAMWELLLFAVLLMVIQGIAGLFFIFGAIPAQVFAHLTITSVYRTLLRNTPPGDLPFPYNPDASPDVHVQSITDALAFGNSERSGDTLTVNSDVRSPQYTGAASVGGDPSSQQHVEKAFNSAEQRQTPADHPNPVGISEPGEAIVSLDGIGYDESAKNGVQVDNKESDPVNPVDNRPGENDKTANEF